MRRGPAIVGDEEPRADCLRALDCAATESVAILHPVGHEGSDGPPQPAQDPGPEGGRGDAVHIVVTKDQDRFVAGERLVDPADGAVAISQQKRVMQVVELRLEELLHLSGGT